MPGTFAFPSVLHFFGSLFSGPYGIAYCGKIGFL
jgi:hypothetical protein